MRTDFRWGLPLLPVAALLDLCVAATTRPARQYDGKSTLFKRLIHSSAPSTEHYGNLRNSFGFQNNMSQVACAVRDIIFVGQFI